MTVLQQGDNFSGVVLCRIISIHYKVESNSWKGKV